MNLNRNLSSGFRAQVRSNDGSAWVDGGYFTKRKNAEADAERLAELFGNEVRVIEQEDPLA